MGSGQSLNQNSNGSPRRDKYTSSTDDKNKQKSNQKNGYTPRNQSTNQSSQNKSVSTNQDQRNVYGKLSPIGQKKNIGHAAANHKLTPRPKPANHSPLLSKPTNHSLQPSKPSNQRSNQNVHFDDQLEKNERTKYDHISIYDMEDEDSDKKTSKGQTPRESKEHQLSEDDINSYSQKYMTTPRLKKEKIETALRSSRVPETKVRHLANHISYIPGDEANTEQELELFSTEKILRKTVSHGLDPILYGTPGKTNLNHYDQNPQGLAKKVSEMVQQVDLDLQSCIDNLETKIEADDIYEDEEHQADKGKSNKLQKSTNDQKKENDRVVENKKSLTLTIQDGIRNMKTNYDILLERYENLLRENELIGSNNEKNEGKAIKFQEDNLKLEQGINALKQKLNHSLTELEQANVVHNKLRMKVKETELDKDNLLQQNDRLLGLTKGLTRELNNLQDDVARATVENTRLTKEFRRLQEPDKKVKQQIQRMEGEVQELRTQNRKLENEKGTIRATLQKLEATHEVAQVERKYLAREKEALVKEMNSLKAEKRRLILSG